MGFDLVFDGLLAGIDIACYGDSLTDSVLSDWVDYASASGIWQAKRVWRHALGGVTTDTILGYQTTDLALPGQPYRYRRNYFWGGHNDSQVGGWDGSNTLANIAAFVARCQPGNFRILEQLPYNKDAAYQTGGAKRIIQDSVNATVKSLYGSAFIPLIAPLQAKGDNGTQDNADIALGLVPTSLRKTNDSIHLSKINGTNLNAGNYVIYQQMALAG